MRKRVLGEPQGNSIEVEKGWMNLEELATVEIDLLSAGYPIESAFRANGGAGWRAAGAGNQLIRLVFDHPFSLHHIQLRFDETTLERTQEFKLLPWVICSKWASKRDCPSAMEFQPRRLYDRTRRVCTCP